MADLKYEFSFDLVGEVNGEARVSVTAKRIGEELPLHIDTLNLLSSVSRKRFCKDFAHQADDQSAADEAEKGLLLIADKLKVKPPPKVDRQTRAAELLAKMPEDVRRDAEGLLHNKKIVQEIKDDIERMGVVGDENVALGIYLIGTSRLLDTPLAGIVRGASSSGKSFGISTVAKLFPAETKLEAHHLSAKSLYYMADDALVHLFVIGGERARQINEESQDATKALREMISDGVLRYVVTEQVNGKFCAIPMVKTGPIAFVESTSASTIFAEDQNRCLIFHADESREQTDRILKATADRAAGKPLAIEEVIIPVHHALQRMLGPVGVVIPFAPFLAESFPKSRVEARRAMPHLLNTVRAVALLRQRQKTISEHTVTADADDYAVALDVVRSSINQLRGGINEQVKRVWKAIEKHVKDEDEEFTRSKAATWSGMRENDSNGRLRVLAEAGFIVETVEAKGSRPAKFKVCPSTGRPDIEAMEDVDLPTPEEVRQQLDGRVYP